MEPRGYTETQCVPHDIQSLFCIQFNSNDIHTQSENPVFENFGIQNLESQHLASKITFQIEIKKLFKWLNDQLHETLLINALSKF